MKTAAAYIRVSTEEQTEYSPDSQLKAIRAYAQSHGMCLPDRFIFADEGISGRSIGKRVQFQRMIGTAKLKPRPFDVILLWKFSRFARNREDSIVYKSMLRRQCGIEVISISEQLSEDKTSILIEALIEAMDEYYSLNLAEEVRRGLAEKFSRGGVISQPPFGYRMAQGKFVPDETAAPVVRMIYEKYLAGEPLRQIASTLNDMGMRTRRGHPFENRTVEYILTNPVYTGKLRRRQESNRADRFHEQDICVSGQHVPVISQEMFDAVQERRAALRAQYPKYARREQADYLLKGLVRCDACGAVLVRAGDYLQCHNYSRGRCSVSHAVSEQKINRLVLERVLADLGNLTVCARIEGRSPEQNAVPFPVMIAKEEQKLLRLQEAYAAGVDTLEEYRTQKAQVNAQIAALREQQDAQAHADTTAFTGIMQIGLDILRKPDISADMKNLTLRVLTEQIVLHRPENRIVIVYASANGVRRS